LGRASGPLVSLAGQAPPVQNFVAAIRTGPGQRYKPFSEVGARTATQQTKFKTVDIWNKCFLRHKYGSRIGGTTFGESVGPTSFSGRPSPPGPQLCRSHSERPRAALEAIFGGRAPNGNAANQIQNGGHFEHMLPKAEIRLSHRGKHLRGERRAHLFLWQAKPPRSKTLSQPFGKAQGSVRSHFRR
jgi:hypothetical protein